MISRGRRYWISFSLNIGESAGAHLSIILKGVFDFGYCSRYGASASTTRAAATTSSTSSRARAAGGRRPRPTCRTHPAERSAGPPTLPGPAIARLSAPLSWRHPEASRGVGPRVVVIERAAGTGVPLLSIAALACFCAVVCPGKRVASASSTQTPTQAPGLCPFWGSVRRCQRGSSYPLKKKLPRGASTPKELRGHAIAAEPRSSKPCPRPSRGRRTARATCCARHRFRELSANRRVS